ncbi:MAG: ABC transporter ATP-binding protein [Polyangiales bacterium]
MSGDALVRAKDVTRSYGVGDLAVPVLHGINLEIRAGELSLLMGPSGSGKTTLLSILAGLLRPTTGDVELCGVPISSLPDAEAARVRRRNLGFVFQTYNLFPALTALDNVAEVLALQGRSIGEARDMAKRALEHVGLATRLHHRPGELSGGQKQRVAIARALAGDPRLVLGDEITAALDSATGMAVMEILRGLVDARRGVLIVTHDHRMERFADRIIEIEDGLLTADRSGGHA